MKNVNKCPRCFGLHIRSIYNHEYDVYDVYCENCLYKFSADTALEAFLGFFDMERVFMKKVNYVSAKMMNLAVSLGALAGKVGEEEWQFIKLVKENLVAQAELVRSLENNLTLIKE